MSGDDIRNKRALARIPGHILCRKLGISRTRLSEIETGISTPSAGEMLRISAALDELIAIKSGIERLALQAGWPMPERFAIR